MNRTRQVAALPIRQEGDGVCRVLLVTSRETRRWVIPKGWPWRDLADHLAAAGEAREEAGVLGEPQAHCIGHYDYEKRRSRETHSVKVAVYLLAVTQELEQWPEAHQRQRAWFTPQEAAALVHEPGLSAIIAGLQEWAQTISAPAGPLVSR